MNTTSPIDAFWAGKTGWVLNGNQDDLKKLVEDPNTRLLSKPLKATLSYEFQR